jgi:CheY-like chemotaxis protein/tetratricopeptide (TPR) repeat protein
MSPTILFADADRRLCQILARALGVDGVRVLPAHDADAALRIVEDSSPALAVVDLGLPGCDGLAVLAAIRARKDARSEMPALLLSASAPSAAQVEQARRFRASAILMKPVALENLGARIRRLLPQPGGRDAASVARPRAVRSTPLRGTLQVLPFPALLHEAHGLRACGVLRFEDGPRRKEIEFVDGRPASVRSNLPGERLGEWLLRNRRVERGVIQESIRRMQRGEGRQGEVLLAMQALSEETLAAALRDHADDKLFEIFSWSRGRFELRLGARLEQASALSVTRSPANVIRLGVSNRFPIERIDAVLQQHVEHVALAGSNPFYSFQEIELSDADVALLAEAERGLPVRSLITRAPETRRTAYALLETGLLELRDGAVVRQGGPAARVRLHEEPSTAKRSNPPSEPAMNRAPTTQMDSRATAHVPKPAAGVVGSQAPATVLTVQAASSEATEAPEHAHYAADHEQRAALAALLVGLRRPSPFDKLGLRRDTTPAEIRRAYTELAKRAHPDRFAAASEVVRDLAEEAFREITRAYQLLADPVRLEQYRQDPERDAKNAKAVEEAQRALAAEQEFQAGESRLRVYDWAGALAHFERASELYPEEGEYLAFCGWAYYLTHGHDEGVFRKAFALVKRGAKLAPDRDKPYLFLGRLSQAAGRLDLAEKMFVKAVERRPDCTEALRELRLLSMRRPKQGLVGRLLRRPGVGDAKKRAQRSG